MIEDPLEGIKDLKNGIIKTPLIIHPLKKDLFRSIRIMKESAQYSFRISNYLRLYIKNNIEEINVLISYINIEIFKRIL